MRPASFFKFNLEKHISCPSPPVHRKITDESTGGVRFCSNEKEQLLATQEYHQRWMDASGAEEEVAYCKLVTKEELRTRGV